MNEQLWYGPMGELVMRQQQGVSLTWYAGAFATVTGSLSSTCQGPGCPVDTATLSVDAHVLLRTTRIASVRSGASSRTLYYYRDRQGSVVATSTPGGAIGVRLRYGPYGAVVKLVDATGNPVDCSTSTACPELGYTGALQLSGSLVYLNARVYDTDLRRFLSADSVDLARYAYTGGDPANHTDPSGHRMTSDIDARPFRWLPGAYLFNTSFIEVLGKDANGNIVVDYGFRSDYAEAYVNGYINGNETLAAAVNRAAKEQASRWDLLNKTGVASLGILVASQDDEMSKALIEEEKKRGAVILDQQTVHTGRFLLDSWTKRFADAYESNFEFNLRANIEFAVGVGGSVERLVIGGAVQPAISRAMGRASGLRAVVALARILQSPAIEVIGGPLVTDIAFVGAATFSVTILTAASAAYIGSAGDAAIDAAYSATAASIYVGLSNSAP